MDIVRSNLRRQRSFSTFPLGNRVALNQSYSSQLDNQPPETQRAVFKLLIEEETSQVLKYNALRALLKQSLTPPITVDKATLIDLVQEALDLAQILIKKYDLYINEHASFLSRRALKKHQVSYQRWLESATPVYTIKNNKPWTELCWEWFRSGFTTEQMNPRRLYLIRERRLLVLLVPVIKDFGNYSSWILWADAYVAPFLAYLGVVFFLPRLIFNLNTMYNNVFNEQKMMPEAKNLSPVTRFMAQWNRLWPQILNDVAWAVSAALMCFVLIGSLQPLAIYLSVGMQFYDVLLGSIRAWIDFSRLNMLADQYENLPLDPNLPSEAKYKELHPLYCHHLKTGIRREKALLYLALANATVLFFAVCMSLPFMVAIHPLFPILGAVIAIIMTVINFQGRNYLNTPASRKLENLLELGQPACPVNKARASSTTTIYPFCQHIASMGEDEEANQNLQGPPVPPLTRDRSSGISDRFFSANLLPRSQSNQELKVLSESPSPTGIAISHSRDDLDAYMEGGIVFR